MTVIDSKELLERYLAGLTSNGIAKARSLLSDDSRMQYYMREQDDEDKDDDKKAATSKNDKPAPQGFGGGDDKKSKQPTGGIDAPKQDRKPQQDTRDAKDTGSKQRLTSPEAVPNLGDVSYDMIKDKLNIMRSGQSLNDQNIGNEMQHYYNNLTDEERLALWKFLNGIAGILIGMKSGKEATDPDRPPGDITVRSVDGRQQQRQQSSVPRRVIAPERQRPRGIEDTMAPIRVVQDR